MRRYGCLSMLAGVLALLSVQARSQNAETIADVRCVVVGVKLAGTGNSSQQSAGMLLALYYMGRLEGRVPKLDVEPLLTSEIGNMKSTDYAIEAKRCGEALAEKGQQITHMGKNIAERQEKSQDKPSVPAK